MIFGTVWANRKQMAKTIEDKRMKRGDFEFIFSGNTIACKCMDNRSVVLLSSAPEVMTDILWVQSRGNASNIKSLFPCSQLVKLYNSGIGGVALMNQSTVAYRLHWKLSVIFYLRIFFDLIDVACISSYLIYNMNHPNKLSLLDYKIVGAKNLIQRYQGWKSAVPMSRPSKRNNPPE